MVEAAYLLVPVGKRPVRPSPLRVIAHEDGVRAIRSAGWVALNRASHPSWKRGTPMAYHPPGEDPATTAVVQDSVRQPATQTAESSRTDMRQIAAETLGSVLETEIIPRLLLAHAATPPEFSTRASTELPDIDTFASLAINADVDDLIRMVERNIAAGVSPAVIFAEVLAPTARRLGVYWEEDICTFTDVTVALGKLQRLVHRFSAPETAVPQRGRTVLLSPAPGEQHTLGLTIVADAFRDARWAVTEEIDATESGLQLVLRRARYDLVGLTVATEAGLSRLPELIHRLRAASMNRNLTVLVGGWPFAGRPELAEWCGADATASDGVTAVAKAVQLLDAHTARV